MIERTQRELETRGLLLDALTCLKSAHEEMLRGNYQRADMYLAKAEVITAETRKKTDELVATTGTVEKGS
jgi:hypothetical protein